MTDRAANKLIDYIISLKDKPVIQSELTEILDGFSGNDIVTNHGIVLKYHKRTRGVTLVIKVLNQAENSRFGRNVTEVTVDAEKPSIEAVGGYLVSSSGVDSPFTRSIPNIGTSVSEILLSICLAYHLYHIPEDQFTWIQTFIELHNTKDKPLEYQRDSIVFALYAWRLRSKINEDIDSDNIQKKYCSFVLRWTASKGCVLQRDEITGIYIPTFYIAPIMYRGSRKYCASFISHKLLSTLRDHTYFDNVIVTGLPRAVGYYPSNTPCVTYVTETSRGERIQDYNVPLEFLENIIGGTNNILVQCETPACRDNRVYFHTRDSATLCPFCMRDKYPSINVMDYSTNPLGVIKVTLPQENKKAQFPKLTIPFLMGCELEYNCDSTKSLDARKQLLSNLNNFVIFKRDSSLNDGGFEVVTIPALKEEHFDRFSKVFTEFPPQLKISSTTGMHIHLDRKVISPLVLGRMIDFLNRPENKGFVEFIGERELNNYCEARPEYSWGRALNNDSMQRHVVLNLHKKVTAEFRFFKSPKQYPNFAKNLEFIWMLWNFYQTGWINYPPKESRNYKMFLDYIRQKNSSREKARNSSPNLYNFVKEYK